MKRGEPMAAADANHRTRKCKVFRVKDEVRKSAAELLVLQILCEGSKYTYELAHIIRERSDGILVFSTLYQAIYRLKDLGYIQEVDKVLSEDNRVRVYFSITEEGRAVLPKMLEEYRTVVNAINGILGLSAVNFNTSQNTPASSPTTP